MLAWCISQAGRCFRGGEAHHEELVQAALIRQRGAHHLQVAHHLHRRPHTLGFLCFDL